MASAAGRTWFVGVLAVGGGQAFAAEWAVEPQVYADADTQSNRTLHEGTPASQSLAGGLDLNIVGQDESTRFALLNHYYVRRFSDDVVPNSDDASFNANLQLSQERGQVQFGAVYADESTLTTELATSGVIHADAARITRGGNAGWTRQLSDSRQFQLSGNYEQVDYTGGYVGQLNAYNYGGVSAVETFTYSPRLAFSVNASGSALKSETQSESREYGVGVGMNFAWSENLTVSLEVDASRRDLDGTSSTGGTGNFSLQHTGERHEFSINYGQSLQPFATGVLTERETAEVRYVQYIDSRLRSVSRVGFERNEDAGFGTTFDSRNYRYLDTELRWQFQENWYSSVTAGYATATDLGATESVGGWSLALRAVWTPDRHVFGH
jgi:hypothetical protein